MNTTAILRTFCDAVEQRNGAAFAELFTEDGVYHDVFYGAFAGRARIAAMIDDWFYRTATDFRWDMHAPVSDGTTLYARYTFSYRSTAGGQGCTRDVRGCSYHDAPRRQDRGVPRGCQYCDRFCGHEFRAGAHSEVWSFGPCRNDG
jgi:ketosteroid isomerase-like protein